MATIKVTTFVRLCQHTEIAYDLAPSYSTTLLFDPVNPNGDSTFG